MGGKKAQEKAQKKVIEDKTFGLKNKNRSSKVQAYIVSLEKSVHGNPQAKKSMNENEARRQAREEKKRFEAEMQKLFKPVKDKVGPATEEEEDPNLGVDPEDYLFQPEDFDEVEHDEKRLEEKLEAELEALKDRTDLTPVTEETFQKWKESKRVEALEHEKTRLKKAKETGKLRGWDLWQENQALFVDDDDADDIYEREELDEEDLDLD